MKALKFDRFAELKAKVQSLFCEFKGKDSKGFFIDWS